MTKLTEEIVMQRLRNCSSPLEAITKINITGRDLDDISLLRKMASIEVLSLSVNKITTLCDLQSCKFLKELYLRKNNISDINEIYYIKNLPLLTVLGLSQNPCSNSPNYRMTVIKNLPKLERLDDVPIMPEERVEALRKGMKVIRPDEDVPDRESQLEKGYSDDVMQPIQQPLELDKTTSHHSTRFRPPSKTVSQCLRMDLCSPDSVHQDIPDRPKAVGHSNLLPGILVLVTDLDYYSLEILSLNIKNRMNEYQMNAISK